MKFRIEYGDPSDPCVDHQEGDGAIIEPMGPEGSRRLTVENEGDIVREVTVGPHGLLGYEVQDG